jgi:tetratricopeptide (TPR) repeat protein
MFPQVGHSVGSLTIVIFLLPHCSVIALRLFELSFRVRFMWPRLRRGLPCVTCHCHQAVQHRRRRAHKCDGISAWSTDLPSSTPLQPFHLAHGFLPSPIGMTELRDPRLESLEENLELSRAALRTRDTPAEARSEPDPYSAFSNDDLRQAVAEALVGLYQVLPQRSFLDEAIELYEDVLTRRPVGDCQRAACLLNLSVALRWRWILSGQADEDLHRFIGLLRNALEISLSEASRDLVLNNLANALWTSYQRQSSRDVLLESIELHRRALLLRPVGSANRALSLCNLANTLHTDYQAHGDSNALEEAVLRYREALEHCPTSHPDRDLALSGLARVLESTFKLRGDRNMLNEAVQLHREAFAIHSAGHPRRSVSLNNLASVLETDWTHFGSYDALTEALKHRRKAFELLPEGHADRRVAVSGLARTLYKCFQRNGDSDALQEAITLFREELSALPLSHWDRASSLHSLANALLDSCQNLGNLNHLAESIGLLREALLLCPPGNPRREDSLNSLANALHTRFVQQGDSEVLSEAITLYEEALKARPPGHLSRIISLNNLAGALLSSFHQSQDSDTLAEVIHLHREALALCSDEFPMRAKALRNLAVALQLSCLHNCTTDAVKEIISLHREALFIPINPGRYVSLLNLGSILVCVASHTHNSQTWAQVLPLFQEALQCCPVGHPMRSDLNRNIGRCLLKTGSPIFDFPRGIEYLNDGLGDDLAPVKERLLKVAGDLRCVEDAWDYAVKSADQEVRATVEQSVLRLYRKAIMLLPRMANFGLDHSSRFRTLLGSDEISRTAATRAVLVGLGVEAIEMLEEGRGIFWARALHLRTTDLKDVPQQDCLELQRLFNILERSAHSSNVPEEMPEDRERTVETRRQLNIQAEALISRIRAYPGLQRFLMPPAFAMLAQSLPDGYAVIINTSRLGCHALLLSKGGGLSISLGLNPPSGGFYSERIRGYLPRDMGSSYSDPAPICTDVATESRSLRISSKSVRSLDNVLAILWSSVVKPVINGLSLQVRSIKTGL